MTPNDLRDTLATLGISQTAIAPVVGFSPRTVRRWIAGTMAIPKLVEEKLGLMVAEKRKGEPA